MIAVAALVIVVVIAGFLLRPRIKPILRDRLVRVLQEHYQSNVVEMGDVDLEWYFPFLRLTTDRVTLRRRGQNDQFPLMQMQRITIYATISGVLKKPYHLRRVDIEGFRIHIPPRRQGEPRIVPQGNAKDPVPDFLIDDVVADDTLLVVHTSMPGKAPLEFPIEKLRLNSAGTTQPMKFRALLTNALPPGRIASSGSFGPWNRDEPGETPVAGSYKFNDADLSVFPGIGGILSSQGEYRGLLDHHSVNGSTDIADFRVNVSGNRIHLQTKFSAVVDGTDGDTYLQPVTAQFGRTSLVARGKIEGTQGVKGKTIALTIAVNNGRLEDLMRLATRGRAPMNGGVSLQTKFLLPPGKVDIADKLYLNGKFGISSAMFTNPEVERKIGGLRERAQGHPKDAQNSEITGDVAANFRGQFVLKDAMLEFPSVSFDVPGASVDLDGGYGLRSEELDFQGHIRMQAKISQTQTGIKSFLLKAVDPFFKKEGAGAVLPIKITGTREQPQFGLNFHRGPKERTKP